MTETTDIPTEVQIEINTPVIIARKIKKTWCSYFPIMLQLCTCLFCSGLFIYIIITTTQIRQMFK